MVFGQIYVALTQPMGTNQQMLKVDLKGMKPSTDFSTVMGRIAKNKRSKYNQMLARTRLAASIDAVSYVVIGLIVGLIMYFGTEEEERDVGSFLWPVVIGSVVAGLSILGAAFPVFAMMGYRSELAQMVDVCGADLGKGFGKCWSEFAKRQARLQAARIKADATDRQTNAMFALGTEFLNKN